MLKKGSKHCEVCATLFTGIYISRNSYLSINAILSSINKIKRKLLIKTLISQLWQTQEKAKPYQ